MLGAFIVCFRKPVDETALNDVKELLENVSEVVKQGCGYSWDGVCLAVAMPQSQTPFLEKSFDEWEEICQKFGFEFVDFETKGRNEYAGGLLIFVTRRILIVNVSIEPMGLERLKEALEANEWDGGDDADEEPILDVLGEDNEEAEGSIGFDIDAAEMEEEMAGMKRAIYGGSLGLEEEGGETDQDQEVEKLQAMMLKMQAVRGEWLGPLFGIRLTKIDMGADFPEAERKKLAAKAVREIMKTL